MRELHERLRPRFARPEAFQHALLYLQAILSDIPRKNGWQIAEQARQAHPYGMQRLLSRAVWDQDAVRDELRALVCQSLLPTASSGEADETPFPVLALDESGFPKRGRHSNGLHRPFSRHDCPLYAHSKNPFQSQTGSTGHLATWVRSGGRE